MLALSSDWSGILSHDKRPVYEALKIEYGWLNRGNGSNVPFPSYDEFWNGAKGTLEEFLRSQGFDVSSRVAKEMFVEAYRSVLERGLFPEMIEGVTDFIEGARGEGVKLYINSAHPDEFVRREARYYGIYNEIACIAGGLSNKEVGINSMCVLEEISDKSLASHMGDVVQDYEAAVVVGVKPIVVVDPMYGYQKEEVVREGVGDVKIYKSLREVLECEVFTKSA